MPKKISKSSMQFCLKLTVSDLEDQQARLATLAEFHMWLGKVYLQSGISLRDYIWDILMTASIASESALRCDEDLSAKEIEEIATGVVRGAIKSTQEAREKKVKKET